MRQLKMHNFKLFIFTLPESETIYDLCVVYNEVFE